MSKETQELVVKSLESTLHKLSKAAASVKEKGENTNLVEKRRDAIRIGLEILRDTWSDRTSVYDRNTILSTMVVLKDILPSIERQLLKAKKGSAQETLGKRRHLAISLALETLEEHL